MDEEANPGTRRKAARTVSATALRNGEKGAASLFLNVEECLGRLILLGCFAADYSLPPRNQDQSFRIAEVVREPCREKAHSFEYE